MRDPRHYPDPHDPCDPVDATCPSTMMTNRSSKVSSRRTHIQTALEPARNQARFQRARSVSPIVSMLAIADARLVEPLVQSQEQPVVSH